MTIMALPVTKTLIAHSLEVVLVQIIIGVSVAGPA
jgi:hypothetical protein